MFLPMRMNALMSALHEGFVVGGVDIGGVEVELPRTLPWPGEPPEPPLPLDPPLPELPPVLELLPPPPLEDPEPACP